MADRPERRFAVLVGVALAAMLLGIVAGRFMRSPAQKALDTAPPPVTRLTAPVEAMAAKGTAVARATITTGQRVSIGPVTSSSPLSVITRTAPRPGATIAAGQQVLEVSGRPVIALVGSFPAYRDLKIGDRGPDARQLNRSLASLGRAAGAGDEVTDATIQGLTSLYAALGHTAPTSGMDRREVVFIPSSPATVVSNAAPVGATAGKPDLVVMTAGTSSASAKVPADAARTIAKGASATLDLDGGQRVDAVVDRMDVARDGVTVVLRPSKPFPEGSEGKDVRASIQQKASGKDALAVPLSAVYARNDGQTVVLVQRDGKERPVPVTTGATVDGMVEVAAVTSGDLKLADRVVVSGP